MVLGACPSQLVVGFETEPTVMDRVGLGALLLPRSGLAQRLVNLPQQSCVAKGEAALRRSGSTPS